MIFLFPLDRPKTASSSQDSVSTTGSAESDEKFRKVVNVLDPHSLCYEDDEDMQEDEVEDPSDLLAQAQARDATKDTKTGKDGKAKPKSADPRNY